MRKLLAKLLRFFGFGKAKNLNGLPVPGVYKGRSDANRPYRNYEPLKASRKAKIQSFLWKPTSYGKELPVVSVGCDGLPRDQLFIQLENSEGEIIPLANNAASGRSVKLPNHDYARINFQPRLNQRTLFLIDDVIVVRFYRMKGKKKVFLKIMDLGTRFAIPDISKKYYLR